MANNLQTSLAEGPLYLRATDRERTHSLDVKSLTRQQGFKALRLVTSRCLGVNLPRFRCIFAAIVIHFIIVAKSDARKAKE